MPGYADALQNAFDEKLEETLAKFGGMLDRKGVEIGFALNFLKDGDNCKKVLEELLKNPI